MNRRFRFAPVVLSLLAAAGTVTVSAGHPQVASATYAASALPRVDPVRTGSEKLAAARGSAAGEGIREVRAAAGFSMVGLSWTGTAPDSMRMRTRSERGAWSAWQDMEIQDGKDVAASPKNSEPVWTGPATRVQVQASRGGRSVTDEVSVVTVDPGTSPNDAKIGALAAEATASGVPTMPTVVTRAQWGADESIMTWPPEYATTTKAVAIHHTAGTNDYSCTDSAAIIRGIYRFHAIDNGWGDIGYNVLIDKCGTVFEGRTGGLTLPTIGAHTGGFNRFVFGISMLGTFTSVAPPAATLESVSRMAAWKLSNGYVDSTAQVELISAGGGTSKYPAGTHVMLPTIFAHRDVGNTECPGDQGYAALGGIRNRVVELAGDWRSSPIYTKWQALGADTVGPVYSVEVDAPSGGRSTGFADSTITWRSDLGAHWVHGAIHAKWNQLGGISGRLGYPVSDEFAISIGARSSFQNGYITYNATTHVVKAYVYAHRTP